MPSVHCPHCQAAVHGGAGRHRQSLKCTQCRRMFSLSDARGEGRAAAGLSGSDFARNHRCQVCDGTISLRQAAEMTCERSECQQTILRQQARRWRKQREADRQREKAELLLRLVALRGEKFQSLGRDDPEAYMPVVLPARTSSLSELPSERRDAFAEHLRKTVQRAFDGGEAAAERAVAASETASENDVLPAGELTILGNACGTCGGHCCREGATDAFVDTQTVDTYRATHPQKNAEEICDDFLSYIPDVTYEGGCVYQSETGCALPREMRADICRSYYCHGLKDFRRQMLNDGPRRGFAVAINEDKIVRIAIIDERQMLPLA